MPVHHAANKLSARNKVQEVCNNARSTGGAHNLEQQACEQQRRVVFKQPVLAAMRNASTSLGACINVSLLLAFVFVYVHLR